MQAITKLSEITEFGYYERSALAAPLNEATELALKERFITNETLVVWPDAILRAIKVRGTARLREIHFAGTFNASAAVKKVYPADVHTGSGQEDGIMLVLPNVVGSRWATRDVFSGDDHGTVALTYAVSEILGEARGKQVSVVRLLAQVSGESVGEPIDVAVTEFLLKYVPLERTPFPRASAPKGADSAGDDGALVNLEEEFPELTRALAALGSPGSDVRPTGVPATELAALTAVALNRPFAPELDSVLANAGALDQGLEKVNSPTWSRLRVVRDSGAVQTLSVPGAGLLLRRLCLPGGVPTCGRRGWPRLACAPIRQQR